MHVKECLGHKSSVRQKKTKARHLRLLSSRPRIRVCDCAPTKALNVRGLRLWPHIHECVSESVYVRIPSIVAREGKKKIKRKKSSHLSKNLPYIKGAKTEGSKIKTYKTPSNNRSS